MKIGIRSLLVASLALMAASTNAQTSILVGGFSYHFEERRDPQGWNNVNSLLGLEYRLNPTIAVMASRFKNSQFHWSNQVGLQITPVEVGDFHAGVIVGAVEGYRYVTEEKDRGPQSRQGQVLILAAEPRVAASVPATNSASESPRVPWRLFGLSQVATAAV